MQRLHFAFPGSFLLAKNIRFFWLKFFSPFFGRIAKIVENLSTNFIASSFTFMFFFRMAMPTSDKTNLLAKLFASNFILYDCGVALFSYLQVFFMREIKIYPPNVFMLFFFSELNRHKVYDPYEVLLMF